jgi:hypothetical protein
VGGRNPVSSPPFLVGEVAGEDHNRTRNRLVTRVEVGAALAMAHDGVGGRRAQKRLLCQALDRKKRGDGVEIFSGGWTWLQGAWLEKK